ncbi:MAG: sigma 54-interacting transcriptional regulator [Phycisphaerae bacterium]|nr:sigma 54-interacting transcriptional regulator [Phycisphaerae bacterium]MCZ2401511.1 sigma 54-interacting transcriptional regulator [Phycisphaerae bacterium]NUQ49584.1 sigma 54-interacting transcriptional regulator [Phycisphaerae bacterium]
MSRPATLGELQRAGYRYRPVKTELRENLIRKLRAAEPLFPGLVGYDNTVVPQLVNGILARHDILLLGLRGQAKTRILRALPELLDEFVPVVADADVFDDPLEPQLRSTRKLIDIHGEDTAIRWVQRAERYHEKLATPDVTIADLIGDIDLVKHAEGRYLTDESTMHFGLVPRSNRGIFALNELPDLPPRIQVGLFNVLEERDVQIRGYPIRLNLDVLLVFSANPEDYTNRGRIVTPLKDRIGTVVRTHYPLSPADAMRISRANAWLARPQGHPQVELPRFVHEVIEETVRLARQSPHVSQQSGVSVRASITALEVVVANAERRAILRGEAAIVPRVSDLASVQAAARGKIELLLAEDEAAEDRLLRALMGEALKSVAASYLEMDELEEVVAQFLGGKTNVEVGDEVSAAEVLENARPIRGLLKAAEGVCRQAECDAQSPPHLASAVEFVLEALHVNNRLSKYAYNTRTFYRK